MRPWRTSLCLLVLLGPAWIVAVSDAAEIKKPKPRSAIPTVKEIQRAFHGKTESSRINLYVKLLKAEDDADRPEIAAALINGLEQGLKNGGLAGVDLRLLSVVGRYDSAPAEDALKSFLESNDVRVVIVSLRALADSKRLPPWPDLQPLTERDDYAESFALRRGLVDAAEQLASREAMDFLIEVVEDEDGQLKYEAARALTALTGQTFGGQGEKWAAWWDEARDKFEPIPAEDRIDGSLRVDMDWVSTVPRYYGLRIYARRVLFLVDSSGSMEELDKFGQESRLDRAKRELAAAIESLPETAEFDVVAFHDHVVPFSPHLLPATSEAKREAFEFIRTLKPQRDTNCYDSLAMALEADPNLEAIYFLSDGEPTTGAIVFPIKIVEAITLQNQLRAASIYTLGIDARGKLELFLKQLAEQNYGDFYRIR